MVICDVKNYAQIIVPSVYQLKMDFFGHEAIILRSYDIRKQKGPTLFSVTPHGGMTSIHASMK